MRLEAGVERGMSDVVLEYGEREDGIGRMTGET